MRFLTLASAATSLVLLNSCSSDPYHSSGYGYGGGASYTSVFISTGNPRWGYDPHCHAYYDYHRRAYYDPYLYGYYPVGYRPVRVHGAPHPHGWRPGRATLPPPSRVTTVTLSNYRERETSYRSLNHSWARDGGPSGGSRSSAQSSRYNSSSRDDSPRGGYSGRGSSSGPAPGDRGQGPSRSATSPGGYGYQGSSSTQTSTQDIPAPPPYSGSAGTQRPRDGDSGGPRSGPSRSYGSDRSRGGDSGRSGDRREGVPNEDEGRDFSREGGYRGR